MADVIPTGRELEALKVLWARGKATVREIYRAMRPRDGEGELAYTTVLSLLQTMEQKGLVGHEAAGKAYATLPACSARVRSGGWRGVFWTRCSTGRWASTWRGPCNRGRIRSRSSRSSSG